MRAPCRAGGRRGRRAAAIVSVMCTLIFGSHAESGERSGIRVAADGRWLEWEGRRVLLVGDSLTQGWMELGTNFDQHAYLDALASRAINATLLWTYIGVVDQAGDPRIGYRAPTVWPWRRDGVAFDFSRLDEAYFDRLRAFVRHASGRKIVVIITVHDGWTKGRFAGHPFNIANGGPLSARSQYVELADYGREMPATFDPGWGRRARHQYFLERFCARLIEATGDHPNVMYEIFNEGEWYDQKALRAFQVHFLKFFKARTPRPTVVNDDHVGGQDFHAERDVDVISLHRPLWGPHTAARETFRHYAEHARLMPAKPYLFTEPVPAYGGPRSDTRAIFWAPVAGTELDGLMRLMWGTAMGGAGFVVQNDTSFGFDTRAAIARQSAYRDAVLDLEGHAARFFNASGVSLEGMTPDDRLCSSRVCLANRGREYVVYSQEGGSVAVDLSTVTGRVVGRFYNPRQGGFGPAISFVGGALRQVISKPDQGDWVLHLVAGE